MFARRLPSPTPHSSFTRSALLAVALYYLPLLSHSFIDVFSPNHCSWHPPDPYVEHLHAAPTPKHHISPILLFPVTHTTERRVRGVSRFTGTTASALAASMLQRPSIVDPYRPPSSLQIPDLSAYNTVASAESRPSLSTLGRSISRPSSTSTQASTHYSLHRTYSNSTHSLPGLTALASLAAATRTEDHPRYVCVLRDTGRGEPVERTAQLRA
ncbi:hypothetical protein BJ546DRAFT_211981 [Cryomyces antarcticus]